MRQSMDFKRYIFDVYFVDGSGATYGIQVKGAESYVDALIKLVRLASLNGEIQKIERV